MLVAARWCLVSYVMDNDRCSSASKTAEWSCSHGELPWPPKATCGHVGPTQARFFYEGRQAKRRAAGFLDVQEYTGWFSCLCDLRQVLFWRKCSSASHQPLVDRSIWDRWWLRSGEMFMAFDSLPSMIIPSSFSHKVLSVSAGCKMIN